MRPRREVAVGSARIAAFAVISVVMTFPHVSRLGTALPGDSGDALFSYWAVRWAANRLPHLLHGFWSAPIFAGHPRTAAYSETWLGIAPFQWLLQHVFGNPILAMNVIALALWTVSSESTYRLGRRFGLEPAAAVVSAFGFTFATIRLGQVGHYQLASGGLIPLVLLLALRTFERRRPLDAVATAVVWAALTLSASYYGVLTAMALVIIAVGCLWPERRHFRPFVPAIAAFGVTAAVLVGPAAYQYLKLQSDPAFRRGYEAPFALHLSDFLHPVAANHLLGDVPGLRNSDPSRTSENFAFPGFIVVVAAPVGLAVLARARWWRQVVADQTGRRELGLVVVAGVIAVLIAFGRTLSIAGIHPPALYRVAHHLPGFSGIRALVRLDVLFQLALALVAGVGVQAALRRIRDWRVRTGLTGLLAVAVLAESAISVGTVRVPHSAPGDPNQLLAHRPPGIVLELPIPDPGMGAIWAFTEAPRMAVSVDEFHPRVNGYSGFFPPGYPALTGLLNTLPDDRAQAALCSLHVRYVVLRTSPVPAGVPGIEAGVAAAGTGALDPDRAVGIAARLTHTVSIQAVVGGIVVELAPNCTPGVNSG